MPLLERIDASADPNLGEASLSAAYLRDFDALRSFYADDYHELGDLGARADELRVANAFPLLERDRLTRKLSAYLRAMNAPDAALASVARLGDDDTLCVVTGQQPGLLGGPALTLYKAAHCVRLAEQLTQAGTSCVPIFWAASEDHDLDEVNRFTAFKPGENATRFKTTTLRLKGMESSLGAPLERIDLPGEREAFWNDVRALLPEGPARASALALLERGTGTNWGRAINQMLVDIFGSRGLIVLEPRLLRDLDAYQHVIRREIEASQQHADCLERSARRLEAMGFQRPLDTNPYVNFFVIHRGRRRQVHGSNNTFTFEGRDDALSRRGMLAELEQHPERFSTGVRLRPVAQGACLPTLAYVGGPAEIAYHAMLKELFESCEVAMPTLLPRWGFTCALGEWENNPAQPPGSVARVKTELAEARSMARSSTAAISEAETEVRALLKGLREKLGLLANPLGKNLEHLDGRVDKTLRELRGRISADPTRWEGLPDTSRAASAWLEPGGQPQERVISWLSLWPRFGSVLQERFVERSAFNFGLDVIAHE